MLYLLPAPTGRDVLRRPFAAVSHRNGSTTGGRGARLGIVAVLTLAHAGALYALAHLAAPEFTRPERSASILVPVTLRPRWVARGSATPQPHAAVFQRAAPALEPSAPIAMTVADRPPAEGMDVGTRAPQPDGDPPDVRPFALAAGLEPGQGATVVLRLAIDGGGALLDARVEVSGGSDAIDHAAIDYARALTWIGGAEDGRPVRTWIRWGVRLEA